MTIGERQLRLQFVFSGCCRFRHGIHVCYCNHPQKVRQLFYGEFDMTDELKPSEIFMERLRRARELRGLSQSELAERAGKMPPSSIAHFETGKRKPSFDTLKRLATALEVTTDYLLGRVDEPGLAEAGDPLFRDVGRLSEKDRELAKDFLKMLAQRTESKARKEE